MKKLNINTLASVLFLVVIFTMVAIFFSCSDNGDDDSGGGSSSLDCDGIANRIRDCMTSYYESTGDTFYGWEGWLYDNDYSYLSCVSSWCNGGSSYDVIGRLSSYDFPWAWADSSCSDLLTIAALVQNKLQWSSASASCLYD